ncbi:MAG: Uma2 family endonuclease [Candidatus Rokuibacteriota bacterium]
MATKSGLTYADYTALPDDGRRYELHNGELWVTPAPGTRHQEVSLAVAALLHAHVRAHGLGKVFAAPTDCILADRTVLQPDILFVATDRLDAVTERAIEGAPTCVVEILSPSSRALDCGRKHDLYAAHGVPFYWIVDPEARTIEALRLAAGTYEPAGHMHGGVPVALAPFPDLIIDPATIWP